MEGPQPSQNRRELWALPHLPAQLSGPGVDTPDLGGRRPLGSPQRLAQRGQEDELLLGAPRRVREALQHVEAPPEVGDRLEIRRSLDGPLAGPPPMLDRVRAETGLRIVVAEQFRLRVGRFWKLRGQDGCDSLVELLAPGLQERLVGGLLDESVLKDI